MTEDARFEDGAERPLRLRAETAEDLAVISALVQDAVGQTSDIAWMPRHRRFTLLLNRFRWEDSARARRQNRPFERVRCLLTIESATRVRAGQVGEKATGGPNRRKKGLVRTHEALVNARAPSSGLAGPQAPVTGHSSTMRTAV